LAGNASNVVLDFRLSGKGRQLVPGQTAAADSEIVK
jgi:hypothetical protein